MIKLKRYRNNPILTANKNNKWEAGAVFNCSVVYTNKTFHMVYRAVASLKINKKIAMLFTVHPDTPKSSIVYADFDNTNQLLSPKN